MTALSARLGLALEGFTLLPAKQGFPRYLLLAEFAARPGAETLSALPRALDAELEQRNIEYGAKRHSERLEAPERIDEPIFCGAHEAETPSSDQFRSFSRTASLTLPPSPVA